MAHRAAATASSEELLLTIFSWTSCSPAEEIINKSLLLQDDHEAEVRLKTVPCACLRVGEWLVPMP